MKKHYFGVLLSLICYGISAQNTLLYKISGKGLVQPSYIYGTIHITCNASLEPATLDALKKTTQLYLELDMDDPNMQATMMTGMMMKDGKTMKSMLSDVDWKILDDFITKKLGMSAMLMNNMKPFLLNTLLLPGMLDCKIQSVEEALMKVSKEQQEEVFGLERIEEQMAIFDAIPYEAQMKELLKSVKGDFKIDKAELKNLMAVYETKDLEALLKVINTSESGSLTSDFESILLHERNSKWIPRIETIAKEKPTFFGVGAGHLPGPKGVLALLRERGYLVEPVL